MTRRLAFLIAITIAAPAGAQRHLSRPARSVAMDSIADSVVAYFDKRVLVLLDSTLLQLREQLVEGGACLGIAERGAPDRFEVDSVIEPILDEDDPPPTWRGTRFTCPEGFAPIHWHVITPADTAWLYAEGDIAGTAVRNRCRLSNLDRGPFWSQFPFAAMQCGVGIDSITVYHVKARGLTMARRTAAVAR